MASTLYNLCLDCLNEFMNAYDSYYTLDVKKRIAFDEFVKRRNKLVSMCVDAITKAWTKEKIRKYFFIDYGTMNVWDAKTSFKFAIGKAFHECDMHDASNMHVELKPRGWGSCWEEHNCSCGFRYAVDSGD